MPCGKCSVWPRTARWTRPRWVRYSKCCRNTERPGAVSELEQATGRWNYYAAISLGQLPDGAGVPALVQMVLDSNGKSKGLAALEMLTQVATQFPDARAALLEQAKGNKIAPNMWPYLASVLAGDQLQLRDSALDPGASPGLKEMKTFHITSGNQNFYSAPPVALSPDQINLQMALIDELIASTFQSDRRADIAERAQHPGPASAADRQRVGKLEPDRARAASGMDVVATPERRRRTNLSWLALLLAGPGVRPAFFPSGVWRRASISLRAGFR